MKILLWISIVYKLFEVVDPVWEYRVDYNDETTFKLVLISLYQLLPVVAGCVLGMIERRLGGEV